MVINREELIELLRMDLFKDVLTECWNRSFEYVLVKDLKFANKSPNKDPEFAHLTDSGMDLYAYVDGEDSLQDENGKRYVELKPLERSLIHTGIYFELPEFTELQIRPKSGRALKEGLSVLNTPGTVDEGYRNEVCVIAVNLSNEPIRIYNNEKVAQAVLTPVFNGKLVNLQKVEDISTETDRGTDGFGSTGK